MRLMMFLLFLLCPAVISDTYAQAVEVKKFVVAEAQQGVAVDKDHFYVINNKSISKHNIKDGAQVDFWADSSGVIEHLNSGIIINGKLYCAHSNYPDSPMASSIEIFDAATLQHIGNHSFGIFNGSATWVDFHQQNWYVGFAHYTGKGSTENKDNTWTRVVKFDKEWRQIASWVFPKTVLTAFGTRSNSGGFIDENGFLYCTGHDVPELYKLSLPRIGFTLKLEAVLPIVSKGQGIAEGKWNGKSVIWGISRSEKTVIVSSLGE